MIWQIPLRSWSGGWEGRGAGQSLFLVAGGVGASLFGWDSRFVLLVLFSFASGLVRLGVRGLVVGRNSQTGAIKSSWTKCALPSRLCLCLLSSLLLLSAGCSLATSRTHPLLAVVRFGLRLCSIDGWPTWVSEKSVSVETVTDFNAAMWSYLSEKFWMGSVQTGSEWNSPCFQSIAVGCPRPRRMWEKRRYLETKTKKNEEMAKNNERKTKNKIAKKKKQMGELRQPHLDQPHSEPPNLSLISQEVGFALRKSDTQRMMRWIPFNSLSWNFFNYQSYKHLKHFRIQWWERTCWHYYPAHNCCMHFFGFEHDLRAKARTICPKTITPQHLILGQLLLGAVT